MSSSIIECPHCKMFFDVAICAKSDVYGAPSLSVKDLPGERGILEELKLHLAWDSTTDGIQMLAKAVRMIADKQSEIIDAINKLQHPAPNQSAERNSGEKV
jgi:hypothetical protein